MTKIKIKGAKRAENNHRVTVTVKKAGASASMVENAERDEPLSDVIALNGPAPLGHQKNEDSDDFKKALPLYFSHQDHKRVRTFCVNLGTSASTFGIAAFLDAMDYSFKCRSASCGCEFVVRTETNSKLRCPACGCEKLDRMHQW